MSNTDDPQRVIPAQLGFLAIYNPSLGTTDETLDDQIVYYSSRHTKSRTKQRSRATKSLQDDSKEDKNERLRQIGLAQGMVEFGKSFSDGKSIDTIETDKSRIILHELEAGWWLLASIDLTRLPIAPKSASSKTKGGEEEPSIEYSSREVKPPALLLGDLLRAHSIFLLHHASSMSALFVRTRRQKFLTIIARYWDSYLSTWNVMLHGNPATSVYGGIKVAGSGELGIGVGEEERGSGEREVLEGFIGRIEGLVDLVVSRFGDGGPANETGLQPKALNTPSHVPPSQPWFGTGAEPVSEDGAIFLGVGALSRKSLCDITHWMEDIYSWGPRAYGVMDNPTSTRQSREKKSTRGGVSTRPDSEGKPRSASAARAQARRVYGMSAEPSLRNLSPREEAHDSRKSTEERPPFNRTVSKSSSTHSSGMGSTFTTYLKLGYGTHWSLGGTANHKKPSGDLLANGAIVSPVSVEESMSNLVQAKDKSAVGHGNKDDASFYPRDKSVGHYLIGLVGDVEAESPDETEDSETTADEATENESSGNRRTLLRTVTVELEREGDIRAEADVSIDLGIGGSERGSSKFGGSQHTGTSNTSFDSQDRNKTKKLQVVVYVNKPFIFTFFFELRTPSLAFSSFYRSIHYQLNPLIRPLLASTKHSLARPDLITTSTADAKTPIYDLIWDPKLLTISSTIPNIPESGNNLNSGKPPPWSRMEALNTHAQLLNTFTITRATRTELERTCKTSRGYWVVWTRIPEIEATPSPSPKKSPETTGTSTPSCPTPTKSRTELSIGTKKRTGGHSKNGESTTLGSLYSGPAHPFLEFANTPKETVPKDKEIFLVRQASDYTGGRTGRYISSASAITGESGWGSAPAKLAQGIGVDTKRYIEGLLSMNR